MADAGNIVCSFCGQTKEQATVMIGVPGTQIFICDLCVRRAQRVIAEPGQTASTAIATIQPVADAARDERCCFCAKYRDRVAAMASTGDIRICDQCLDLCDEILSEVPPLASR